MVRVVPLLTILVLLGCVTSTPRGEVNLATDFQTRADQAYTEGEVFSQNGRIRQAIQSFRQALVFDPSSQRIRLRLAREHIRAGELSDAMILLEEIEKQSEGKLLGEALLLKAQIFQQSNQPQQAIDALERAMGSLPEDLGPRLSLVSLYAEAKNYKKAIELAQTCLELPQAPVENLHYLLGKLWEENSNKNLARRHYEKALELKPSYVDPLLALVALDVELKESQRAIERLEKWQEVEGPNPRVAESLFILYVFENQMERALNQARVVMAVSPKAREIQYQLALILIEKKEWELAKPLLKEFLKENPQFDRLLFTLGVILKETGEWDEAIRQFQQIPISSPFYLDSVWLTFQIYWDQRELKKAKSYLMERLHRHPHAEEIFYIGLVTVLDELKEFDESLKYLEEGTAKLPDSELLQMGLALNEDRRGLTDLALERMQKLLQKNPNLPVALNYVAYIYAERGIHLEEALEMAQRALQLQPDASNIMDTIGWIYFKMNNFQESVSWLEKALELSPKEPTILEHLADVYSRLGIFDKAVTFYSLAHDYADDSTQRARILEKMEDSHRQAAAVLQRSPASRPRKSVTKSKPYGIRSSHGASDGKAEPVD